MMDGPTARHTIELLIAIHRRGKLDVADLWMGQATFDSRIDLKDEQHATDEEARTVASLLAKHMEAGPAEAAEYLRIARKLVGQTRATVLAGTVETLAAYFGAGQEQPAEDKATDRQPLPALRINAPATYAPTNAPRRRKLNLA